jgi:hypothetical protein
MQVKRATRIAGFCLIALVVQDAIAPPARAQSVAPEIVLAQAQEREGGIFRFLTRPFRPREAAPQVVPQQQQQQQQARPRRQREASRPRRQRRSEPAAEAPRAIAEVEKAADAKRVLVIGDFMAGALSKGLAEAYAENANVLVIDGSNGSSGLVRDDFYNWPGELPAIVEAQKPDAILVLIGANDRQPLPTAGGSQEVGGDGWRIAYAARVAALADVLKATTRPVLWAGLPPVNSGTMSRDYSAFNGVVREQLESKGLRFIETWDGFADAEGKFVAVGPDITGQSVQLRTGDLGLNFTRAGQRKLAYFVEQELNAILGGAAPQIAAADAAAATASGAEPAEPAPQIGPMVNIEALAVGEALSGTAPGARGTAAASILRRLSGNGNAPPAGRADNYAWPGGATP